MQSAVWDAESGVWLGDRAPFDGSKLPDPLYILGYGSLIWRPGDLLEKYKSYKCTAIGSMRLFAQKSCDHRGTPEFPGLVLNLVEDEVLEECGYRLPGAPQSEFRGLVFHVPHEDVQRVIEELDFRERGGYHRHIIPVKLDNACDGQEGRVVDAIVYTGAPSNPNFLLPKIRRRQSLDAAETDPDTQQEARSDPFCLHRRNIMTDTIAAAVGPSGPNVDYLCNLDRYLGTSDMGDSFLSSLAASVRLRLGPWRGRLYRSADVVSTSNALEDAVRSVSGPALPYRLLGWGSNEFLQLSDQPAPLAVLDAGNQDTSLLAHRYLGAAISDSIPPALSASATTATSAETSTQTPPPPSPDQPHFSDTEGRHVEAGGGSSALLQDGALRVWGKLASALMQLTSDPAGPHSPEQSIVLAGVQGVALGHDHLLLLLQWPVSPGGGTDGAAAPTVEVVLAVGSDSHGQCSGSAAACAALGVPMLRQEDVVLTARQGQPCVYEVYLRAGAPITDFMVRTEGAPCPAAVLKLAVGMRHSALITVDGALLTWGDHSHGQALLLSGAADDHPDDGASSATWRPPNGAKLVDVACGAKYTVLIDSLGEVYRLGGAKKRTEARSSLPMRVEGLPERVRWQRVSLPCLALLLSFAAYSFYCCCWYSEGGERMGTRGAAWAQRRGGPRVVLLRLGPASALAVPGASAQRRGGVGGCTQGAGPAAPGPPDCRGLVRLRVHFSGRRARPPVGLRLGRARQCRVWCACCCGQHGRQGWAAGGRGWRVEAGVAAVH